MAYGIKLVLTKAEGHAFLKAERGGQQAEPSKALQLADFKIREAIFRSEWEQGPPIEVPRG